MIGNLLSFGAGAVLLMMSLMVMLAYRPSGTWSGRADQYLVAAIFLAFATDAANTLYWQVFGHVAVQNDLITVTTLRALGNWLDVLFKGGAALAGYLHLKALWVQLDEGERRKWVPLEMPWYPRKRWCVLHAARLMCRNRKDKK